MNEQTDQQLLKEYATAQSDSAFAELVRRHVDLVYSAARRMVCDDHLAKDVTQGVFLALAQSSYELTNRPVLDGWLHRTAQNLSSKLVRTEVRRRVREQEAVTMKEIFTGEPNTKWEQIAPQLDAALGELSETDRGAILLRYFENKSAREIAAQFGISEEAAHKRTTRSVQRLRDFFARRGVTVGASGLVALVAENGMQAAPAGLAGAVSTAVAVASVSAAATTVVSVGGLKIMTTSLLKFVLVGLAAVAASMVIVIQQNKSVELHQEIQNLHAQIKKSEATTADLADQLKVARRPVPSSGNPAELLQLRNEVGKLRAEMKAHETAQATKMRMQSEQSDANAMALTEANNRNVCINNLRQIDGAVQQWALENKKSVKDAGPRPDEIANYFPKNKAFTCPSGGSYVIGEIVSGPSCSLHGNLSVLTQKQNLGK
ncbi:MAG: polymerase, sigma-24 subunit, subfamily [Verrucomicrobiales bacterium]|nr:polymerase, sigma-24 subunit, subfamily [Verrucomicrobiales bacterium]